MQDQASTLGQLVELEASHAASSKSLEVELAEERKALADATKELEAVKQENDKLTTKVLFDCQSLPSVPLVAGRSQCRREQDTGKGTGIYSHGS